MKFKKFIAIFCVAVLLLGALASCKDNSGSNSAASGSTDSDSGNNGGDANGGEDATSTTPSTVTSTLGPDNIDDIKVLNTEYTSAMDIEVFNFTVVDDRLYYIDNADYYIYSVALDGSDKQELVKEESSHIEATEDGKILYCTDYVKDMTSNTFTINADGTGKEDKNILQLDYYGMKKAETSDGKVLYDYMDDAGDGAGLYISNEGDDPSTGTLVLEGIVDSFCIYDSKIITALTLLNGTGIYRCDLGGENLVKLFDVQANNLITVGDDIYFMKMDDNKIYKMTKDAVLKG